MKQKLHEPYQRLKDWLAENSLTYSDLASLLGVSASTVCAKMNGKSDFTLSEVNRIKTVFQLSDEVFSNPFCCLNDYSHPSKNNRR